jgi:hypothetical protein
MGFVGLGLGMGLGLSGVLDMFAVSLLVDLGD